MKQKLGTVAERAKGKSVVPLSAVQFAFERIAANHERFAKAHNANGKLLKECEIELQLHAETLRKMQRARRG